MKFEHKQMSHILTCKSAPPALPTPFLFLLLLLPPLFLLLLLLLLKYLMNHALLQHALLFLLFLTLHLPLPLLPISLGLALAHLVSASVPAPCQF